MFCFIIHTIDFSIDWNCIFRESFGSIVGSSSERREATMVALEKIHELQKAQEDELAQSGGYFNNLSPDDSMFDPIPSLVS